MIWLKEYTESIEALLSQGTARSLSYAALECRLAIERLIYERLRIVHDYISPSDLAGWQPGKIITQLIADVEPTIASGAKLYISKRPADDYDRAANELADDEYIEIGTQVAFDHRRLAKHWQALGSVLHIRLPRSKLDTLDFFTEPQKMERMIAEILTELHALENGTLVFSGVGEEISFNCICGTRNKRRSHLIQSDQIISCIKPSCIEKWQVQKATSEITFKRRVIVCTCRHCKRQNSFPEQKLFSVKQNEVLIYACQGCNGSNKVRWMLAQQS